VTGASELVACLFCPLFRDMLIAFLGLVIGLPSRDSLIECVDQLYALSMASAAPLDAALDGELLMQVVERLAVLNGIVLRLTGYVTTSGATNILDRSVLGTIRWVAILELTTVHSHT